MIFLDSPTPFPDDFAFTQLMVVGCHLFQINTEYSSITASYLEFTQPFILFKVDLDVLNEIKLHVLTFIIHKCIVVQYRLIW